MPVIKINPRTGDDSDILEINAPAALEAKLATGDKLTLKAGSLKTQATVIVKYDSAAENSISAGLLNRLLLPSDQAVNLMLDKKQPVASIGPIIGILISKNNRLRRPPFSRQKQLLRKFISAGKSMGAVVYAFNPEGIDPDNKHIEGFYPYKNGSAEITWKKSCFPFPDIVHNRILTRTSERKPAVRQAMELTDNFGIKCFNTKFLNKWETHDILYQNSKLRRFLPETVKYQSAEALVRFLDKHPLVYLKPWHGSLGKDILRIKKENNTYLYNYRQGKSTVSGTWTDTAEMADAVRIFVGRRSYLMQQGLELVTYFGRVFDIRVLIQKNGSGHWVISATVARVGREGSPFPNIAAGGCALSIEQVWQDLFHREWARSPKRDQIEQLAGLVAVTLDKRLGDFGEMGLDIGLDNEGKLWLIEVNSKPSRKVFPQGDKALKARSIRLPMEYALHWAGFAGDQPGREKDNE